MLTPLLRDDFPDPSVYFHEGWVYLYGTREYKSPQENIQIRRSSSWLGPWEDLGGALCVKPDWGTKSTEFWAPDRPVWIHNEYRLYYVTNPDDEDGMGIAMARSDRPYGFTPAKNYLLCDKGYTAIDPFLLSYEGEEWLFWGSMREPIRCQKLARGGYTFAPGSIPQEVLVPGHGKYERLIEGFYQIYHPELRTWFAFVSGNDTWNKSNYAVTCYRASSPFGPFERLGVLIAPSKRWWAPGQNSAVNIHGEWYFVCHAADKEDPFLPGTRRLKRIPCVARISFDEGRPRLTEL